MFPNHARVKWWQLYLIILLLIGLFFWDSHLETSLGVHKAVQIAIIVFIYGLICLWIKFNAKVFRETDTSQYTGSVTIIHFHPNSSTNMMIEDNTHRPMLPLHDSYKSDLVNTNIVLLLDETSHDLKKD